MAQSEGEGRGARFAVVLPIRSLYEAGPAQPATVTPRAPDAGVAPRTKPKPGLTGLRILSVDDDPNTREMLQEALQRAGAEVTSAASAPEALEKLQSLRPDVLFSDIGLPEEDGYELVRKVRAQRGERRQHLRRRAYRLRTRPGLQGRHGRRLPGIRRQARQPRRTLQRDPSRPRER